MRQPLKQKSLELKKQLRLCVRPESKMKKSSSFYRNIGIYVLAKLKNICGKKKVLKENR